MKNKIRRGTMKWLIERHARWYRMYYRAYLKKVNAIELQIDEEVLGL